MYKMQLEQCFQGNAQQLKPKTLGGKKSDMKDLNLYSKRLKNKLN